MSQSPPDRPGTAALVDALAVRRNAAIGFALGTVLAAVLVYGQVTSAGHLYSPAWYVALGFVLAVGVGLLVTLILTAGSAYRLARS
ncbi:DUF7536 family protein [Halorarius halobius]|uniref:DUF7536 family protein n=1 Tax=Halorarius halobius TaxID=2962671 RepID=UPI0020CD3B7E|nr:hypothetical protein [Halorarius halobius]